MKPVRRFAFYALLIVSLAALGILAFGFVGVIGVATRLNVPTGRAPFYRDRTITLGRGRLEIWTQTWPTGPPTMPVEFSMR
jgi:hypothetical protein